MGDERSQATPVRDPESTRRLIEQCLSGDVAARERLFEDVLANAQRELPSLRLWRLFGRKKVEAGDVAGEVTLRLLAASRVERGGGPNALQRFEWSGQGSFRAFVVKIMGDVLADKARRTGAQKRGAGRHHASLDAVASNAARPLTPLTRDPTPSSAIRSAELERICDETLVDAMERTAWRRSKIDGNSMDEIARELGIRRRRVRTLLENAELRLRQRLRSAGIAPPS